MMQKMNHPTLQLLLSLASWSNFEVPKQNLARHGPHHTKLVLLCTTCTLVQFPIT